jgi:hypothetical protein
VKKATATFVGTVRERVGKKPVAGVKVALDTGAFAVTDDAGHFTFNEVAPGTHAVTLSGERLTDVATSEELEAGKKLDATYEVDRKAEKLAGEEEDDLEIVVTAARLDKQVVATEVPAEQGRKVPGTQGDVLKVVEDLPGVARSAVGSGALVVWGAAPSDTRVYVDGVRVPRLYHDGGYRSIMQSDMVRSVELIPGGYGPAYGRGLGGLVNVQLARLDDHGFHGSVSADTLDAGASAKDDLTDRLHVQVGGRKSYLDALVGAVTSQNVGAIVPIPQYYDGQARLSYDLGPHETLEVGGLLSSDTTRTTVASPDPALTNTQTTGLDFGRLYARYEKHTEGGETIVVVPSWGKDVSTLNSQFGSTPTALRDDAQVFGLRASWRWPVARFLSVGVGLDAELTSSTIRRTGSLGSPAREGDIYVFGQPPSGQLDADSWTTVVASAAPYAEADFAPFGDQLHIVPGVRFEPYFTSASRLVPQVGNVPSVGFSQEVTAIDPRLSVRYAPTHRLSFKAAVGLYHQPPSGEDLSAVFGTPKLGLSEAEHYVVGSAVGITDSLVVLSPDPEHRPGAVPRERPRPGGGRPLVRGAGAAAAAEGRQVLRLGQLHAHAERAEGPPGVRLAALRLRPDARAHPPRLVRPRPRLRGGRTLPLRDGLPADARDRGVLRLAHRLVPAEVRRRELDPDRRLLRARRAHREAPQGGEDRGGGVPRRAERDEPRERRGDRVRPDLHAAGEHHGAPGPAGGRRQVVVVRGWTSSAWSASAAATLAASVAACEPNLDQRTSTVTGPRVLAVQSTPAEAAPGAPVALATLVVDPSGPVTTGPFDWAFCTDRNPLDNLGPVNPACALPTGDAFVELGAAASATGAVPTDACKLFGPDAPTAMEGQPPGRPVDPDTTGGYYQPVRLVAATDVAVGLVRITCDVPGASPEQLSTLAASDHPNTNPAIDSVTDPALGPLVAAATGTNTVGPSQRLDLRAAWATCDATMASCTGSEAYAYLDAQTHAVVQAREQMRVSWFATGGAFDDDRTGRAATDATPYTDNGWTAPAATGDVNLWVVLRDDRGGVGWQSFVVRVR